MGERLRVLVTGAGALLGQGILRCLQKNRQKYHIVTGDPDFKSPGHWLGDKAVTIPLVKDSRYLICLEEILVQERIQFVLIGTDVELPILSENRERIERQYGAKIIVSNPTVINIANDKWLTAKFLKENNFNYPLSIMAADREAVTKGFSNSSFPVIAKPVDGARSKGIIQINNRIELEEVLDNPKNLVIQEFIPEDDGEYTAGCLVFGGKCEAIIVLKRELRDGNTYRAYSDMTGIYDGFLKKVAEALGVEGPCNFQFRIRDGRPIIFEINARFSGTTPLRMIFGFNEVEAVLDFYLGFKNFDVKLIEGTVLRTFSDLLIPNGQLIKLETEGKLDKPSCNEISFLVK